MITPKQADELIKSGEVVKIKEINFPDSGIFTVKIISRDRWTVTLSDGAKIGRDDLEICIC